MSNGINWLSVLPTVAGLTVVVAIYARQSRRDSAAINQALLKAQQGQPTYIEQRPFRWYHLLAVTALIALPFVQWLAYFEYRTRLAFLLPLAAVAAIILVVGMFRPRFVVDDPVNHHEWGIRGFVVATGLAIGFMLPSSGTVVVLRGVLSDTLLLFAAFYLSRIWNELNRVSATSR